MQNRLREINVSGTRYRAFDYYKSWAYSSIEKEMEDQYIFDDIKIEDGDAIVDIGAHVGIFSMYYAIKFPNSQIYSFEPSARNFNNLVQGIKYNGIENIKPYNVGVSGDGRPIKIVQEEDNSGASSQFLSGRQTSFEVGTVTLAGIFNMLREAGTERVKILKIDCEGSEYEILGGQNVQMLENVDYVMGELHSVRGMDFNPYVLNDRINSAVPKERNRLKILQGFI